jgi:flagellar biogenesis protein FliO
MSARAWSSILARIEARREAQRSRHLRLVETVSLGEKRFVAIVAVRGGEFLIGGGPGSVSLLARLEEKAELSPSCTQVSAAVAPDADALSWATSMPAGSPWRNQ